MRAMMTAALCLASASLASCATATNPCAGADARRVAYVTAIGAADAYAASGRPAPDAVLLGREAAVTALNILDARCPPDAVISIRGRETKRAPGDPRVPLRSAHAWEQPT